MQRADTLCHCWIDAARSDGDADQIAPRETGRSGRIDDSFIDQQNGNVVPDWIDPSAGAAFQALAVPFQHERFSAGGADQDIQQVFGDHEFLFYTWTVARRTIDFHNAGRVNSHHASFRSFPTYFGSRTLVSTDEEGSG